MLDPGHVLPVDFTLPPIDPESHLVLRNLVMYLTRNDGYAPELYELARMTGRSEETVERLLDKLVETGHARLSGAAWYPTSRTWRLPPMEAEPRPIVPMRRAG